MWVIYPGGNTTNQSPFFQGANSTVAVVRYSDAMTPMKHWSTSFGHEHARWIVGRNSLVTGPGNAGSSAAFIISSHIVHGARRHGCLTYFKKRLRPDHSDKDKEYAQVWAR